MNALHDLVIKYEQNAPQYRHGAWRKIFSDPQAAELFTPLSEAHDKNDIEADLNKIWLRVLSRSYISALDKKTQDELHEELTAFMRKTLPEFDPSKGGKDTNIITCPYVTDAFWCTSL